MCATFCSKFLKGILKWMRGNAFIMSNFGFLDLLDSLTTSFRGPPSLLSVDVIYEGRPLK